MQSSKSVARSNTIRTNMAATIAALTMLSGSEFIQQHPVASMWFTALLPAANIVLRFFTNFPIEGVGRHTYQPTPKEFWRSSVFWTNATFLVLAVVGALAGSELVEAYPQTASWFVAIQGVANTILRVAKTDGPVVISKG